MNKDTQKLFDEISQKMAEEDEAAFKKNARPKLRRKSHVVYHVVDRKTGNNCGAYSRAYHTEYDFPNPSEARNAMFSGEYKNKRRYKVAKYRVTYTLIKDDCD